MKKGINLFPSKIILLILTGLSIIYFVTKLILTEFNFNNEIDLLNTILIVMITILLCLSLLTNNKISLFFVTITFVILICFIGVNIYSNLPSTKNKKELITCVGNDDTSDNVKINIDKTNDKINKIEYIYYFNIEDKDKAETISNEFDSTFTDYKNIYSEIIIDSNVELKLIYNLNDIRITKIKKLNTELNDYIENTYISYDKFKTKKLYSFVCKNRN